MKKQLTAAALAASMLLTAVPAAPLTAAAAEPDYAKALQMSLYFYECQQAGDLPEWNRVEWRRDSTTIDEIDGGWYDAGDHVKFNLPMAYSASMLAWGLYQYPDGLEKSGEMQNYVNNLEYVMDYFVRCDKGDSAVFQVGNGTVDHTWWGPVELYEYGMLDSGTSYESAREIFEASEGCSAVFGGMAAALAAGCCALEGRVDDAKITGYLKSAKNLFALADKSRSDAVYNDSNASGFYRSSHFYDELFYASNWLYKATGDKVYLDKAASYIPSLDKELGSSELKYTWGHCWDDTMQGGMLLYAQNSGDAQYINHVKKHVDYWSKTVKTLPGGLRWSTTWGCARYAETAAFIAAVASDTVLKDQDTSAYEKFYEEQINFVLGENPDKQSYVVGYNENSPKNPHHRTAHGSWKNDLAIPETNRHTLYGALVGGPNEDGSYEDDRQNYINNEVATDYNAGFTAILCKMLDKYGGTSDPAFPPKEAHDGSEFYVEVTDKGISAQGATVSFKVTNHSAWPARVQDNLSFRYYMDLSELTKAGVDPEEVVIRCDRDQSAMYAGNGVKPAEISGIKPYSGDIYYVEVTLPDGRAVLPVSEGMQQCEILLALVYPNYGTGWDASNDPSNKDILGGVKGETDEDGTVHGIVTPYVPVYVNGELYYGIEPDGTSADGNAAPPNEPDVKPTQPSTEPKTEPTTEPTIEPVTGGESGGAAGQVKYGDVNVDDEVDILDVIMLNKFLLGSATLKKTQQANADIDQNGKLDSTDSLMILKYVVKLYDTLPPSA